jgi:hypothetical protein
MCEYVLPAAGSGCRATGAVPEEMLALQEELTAGLPRGDRRGGHELGHLADGVRPDGEVVEVDGHAEAPVTCWADQA